MNSAGDDKQRTNHNHEAHVVDQGMEDARSLMNDEQLIRAHHAGQRHAKLVVMALPMTLSDERSECDRRQQDHKRQHDRPVRMRRDKTQKTNHRAIGLVDAWSVNKTRPYQNADGMARSCTATSISAVCGNMSSGVTDSMMNLSCNSLKSRASVDGLQET